ncbi:MAG TPA: hypothetical protein VIF62_18995 [Labilithrix sp.]|jgi:hypothetical protein
MNHAHGNNDIRRDVADASHHLGDEIRGRATRARDIALEVRDRAEETFREKPYLLPVAAGAVGLGLGLLLSSKLTRFIVFTAVGTLVTETLGPEIRRLSRSLASEFQKKLGEGGSMGEDEGEPGTL